MGGACTKGGSEHGPDSHEKPNIVAVNHSEMDDEDSEAADVLGEVSGSPLKGKNFRDRRLTMSQVRDPKIRDRHKRLSVYGGGSEQDVGPVVEDIDLTTIAAKSIPGLEPVPGGAVAKINQDRAVAMHPFHNDAKCTLLGVYDGHGKQGEQVSAFVKEHLPGMIARHPLFNSKPAVALKEAYIQCDEELARSHIEASVSGTTAVTVLIKDNTYWVANSGDSRAVIGRWKSGKKSIVAHDVSFDQKPDTPAEMKRIIAAGGHVTPSGTNGSPARVWHNFRGLAMARSIGDHNAATVGVIAEPEVHQYTFDKDDAVLIIGSDGVWELLESQQVVEIAHHHLSEPTEDIVDRIIEQSAHMWKVEEGDYRDDISCIVLRLPWLEPSITPMG
ncbi:phosphatase 2C-like domain-containing protein [Pavlovales sp. CCMP2436]|nr:phosphatase 2C-like domain-containing protein [Pavlovales sp. CCMP2436]